MAFFSKKNSKKDNYPDEISLQTKPEGIANNFKNRQGKFYYWLCEFIDNSISAFCNIENNESYKNIYKNIEREIHIIIEGDDKIIIADNASGLTNNHEELLRILTNISVHDKKRDLNGYNEHNEGMKSSIIALSKSASIIWKDIVTENTVGYRNSFKDKSIVSQSVFTKMSSPQFEFENYSHGTIITLTDLEKKALIENYQDKTPGEFYEIVSLLTYKYKKWLFTESNDKKIKINIKFIYRNYYEEVFVYNLNDWAKDHYVFFDSNLDIDEDGINEKIAICKYFYKQKDFISSKMSNEEKWEFIENFFNEKYLGKKIYVSSYNKDFENFMNEKYFSFTSNKYTKSFHDNIFAYFNEYEYNYDEALQNLRILLFDNNVEIKNDSYIVWKNKIQISDVTDCAIKNHNSNYDHNILLITTINSVEKQKDKGFKYSLVEFWSGFSTEHNQRLVTIGGNPGGSKYLDQKRLLTNNQQLGKYFQSSHKNFPIRITGNIIVPKCFTTDTNKQELKQYENIDNAIGTYSDASTNFSKIFINGGIILASELLMRFKEYESKKITKSRNADKILFGGNGVSKKINDQSINENYSINILPCGEEENHINDNGDRIWKREYIFNNEKRLIIVVIYEGKNLSEKIFDTEQSISETGSSNIEVRVRIPNWAAQSMFTTVKINDIDDLKKINVQDKRDSTDRTIKFVEQIFKLDFYTSFSQDQKNYFKLLGSLNKLYGK